MKFSVEEFSSKYEIAVCSPLLWISFIWNCGLFTIIMDILNGVFLCILGMLGDLVIIWYMIRNDLYLKMKIVLSRKLVLWNCKYGCEWIYHLFIITNSSNNNNNNRLRVSPTANVTKKKYFPIFKLNNLLLHKYIYSETRCQGYYASPWHCTKNEVFH